MSRVGLTPDGVQALTECRQLARLTRLTLNGNSISEEGVRAILRSPTFARLSQLGVEECGVSIEEAIAAVFAAPARPELTVYLGLGAVALNRPAAGTANFSLSGAGSSPRAVRVLLPDTCPESLSEVQLVRSTERQIPLADLGRWLTGQTIPSLRLLHCGLRNGDVPNLIALMERLRPSTLDLSGNEIGMRGIQALADSPALQTVQHLNLSGNAVNLKGLLALAASPHRGALTNLVLQYCRLSDAVKSALTSAFNGVKVQL